MQYESIPADSLKKTAHGVIPTFAEVFTGARYVRGIRTPGHGSRLDTAPGELFLSIDTCRSGRIDGMPSSFLWDSKGSALVCAPVLPMPEFLPHIAPRNGGTWHMRPPGSIKVIAWPKYGHFLVLATDPNCISDVWLGFVPMDQRFEVA